MYTCGHSTRRNGVVIVLENEASLDMARKSEGG